MSAPPRQLPYLEQLWESLGWGGWPGGDGGIPEGAHLLVREPSTGITRTTAAEVELHLVQRAGGRSRPRLWHDLRTQHAVLAQSEVLPRQLLGGEFVSPKAEPDTLLAVSLLSTSDLQRLDDAPQHQLGVLSSIVNDDGSGLHHGIVADLPDDHPQAGRMARVRAYWQRRLGLTHGPANSGLSPVLEIQLRMSDGDVAIQ